MNAPQTPAFLPDEDALFRVLRQLDRVPEASQRATAEALGLSLGKLRIMHVSQWLADQALDGVQLYYEKFTQSNI